MNQEEYLDQLLETQGYGRNQLSGDNDEITASLAAAERLTRLREIDVPADFTYRLEVSLRAHIRSHCLIPPSSQALSGKRPIPIERHRSSSNVRRASRHQAWAAMLTLAAVLVLAFAGLLALSAHSLPGGPLSHSTQVEHQLTPTFANNQQNAAHADIERLQSALADLRTAVNNRRDNTIIRAALKAVVARTNDCRSAVAAVTAGPARDAVQQDLDRVLTDEEQTIRQLLSQLDWSMQVLFTQQLGVLGDPIPTVTHATVHAQSNGTLLITLTGTHFAPHAELILDGQPKGTVSQITAQQLVAIIHPSQWFPGTRAFGVLNPDGTAAQFVLNGGGDHSGSGTSTPYPDR